MRLRLKIVYLFPSTFLRLKMFKNGHYKNEGLSFTWDLSVIFLCEPILVIDEFFKFLFF